MTITITRTRQLPWVGAGTSGEWDNIGDALWYGGLDYEVEQVDAWDDKGNRVPGILVNRNRATGDILGVTSEQYGVVQNRDAFSLLDPFCAVGGVIEHAGMTAAGMCFMVMRIPGMAFGFEGDGFDLFVCAMNSFNTKFPLALIITPVRVICQNMFRKLMKQGDAVLSIKHGRFASDRILSATKAASYLLDYKENFTSELMTEALTMRSEAAAEAFALEMLPDVPVGPERPKAKQTNERMEQMRKEFISDYYHAPDNEKWVGTKLGIVNAYYDWTTHHVPSRTSASFEDVRLGNLMNGTGINRRLIERI